MGSESDRPVMEKACAELDARALSYEMRVISAHRNPKEVAAYAESAALRGIRVLICGAGMAAALPGVVAAYTELPVIGVPIASGGLGGMDALLAISQMPPGVPVGCMAIGGARNAAIFAVAHPRAGRHADRRRRMSGFGTPEEAARAIALAGERAAAFRRDVGDLPAAVVLDRRGARGATACRCRAPASGLEADDRARRAARCCRARSRTRTRARSRSSTARGSRRASPPPCSRPRSTPTSAAAPARPRRSRTWPGAGWPS